MAILAILLFALTTTDEPPSVIGWVLLAFAALGAFYEDRWIFGPERVVHRVGLIFAARGTELPLPELSGLRIAPFVKGTVPGSEDESKENARALSGAEDSEGNGRRFFSWKRPYLLLILETQNGAEYALDQLPAREREKLRSMAQRISEATGLPLKDD